MTRFSILDAELSLTGAREIVTVDISAFADDDQILLTLPAYPGTKVNEAQTFIDFTSHPSGDFNAGPTDSIAFNQFSPALPTTDGDTEGRFDIALLQNIDRSAITAVRLRVTLTSNGTIKFAGIRAVDKDWVYAPIDFNSLWNQYERAPSPDGDPAFAPAFPTTSASGMPTDFPIIFRSDEVSGERDPRPVDAYISSYFSTGSLTEADGSDLAHFSTLAWYFREIPVDEQVQLELDLKTQAELNAANHQPDWNDAAFTVRRQEDLDIISQSSLDDNTMFDLETQPDYTTHSWLEVKLRFANAASTILTVLNSDGVGYTFSLPELDPTDSNNPDQGQYIALIDLEENSLQFRLYGANQVGEIDKSNLVFSTNKIVDDTLIKRRKGRLGWYAQLLDGDAALYNIRQRDMSFGEVITKPFESVTPVMGAQLFVGGSDDLQLVTEVLSGPWGVGSIGNDSSASASGGAKRITTLGGKPLQGIATNPFVLDNFRHIDIGFRIKYPADSLLVPGAGLDIFLYGEYGRCIPLNVTPIHGDKWETIRATLPDDLIQTGTYQLMLIQTLPNKDTTWWIEDLSVTTPTLIWSGRSKKPDAWDLEGDQWVPFDHTLNKLYGGVVFEERGNGLQVRGRALRQNAVIQDFKVVPKYAELGRFVWSDEIPAQGSPPTATISSSINGKTVSFNGTASADPDGFVVAYHWSYGDETNDFGSSVSHTYDRAGTYNVTLVVVDNMGNLASASTSVTVS